MINFIYKIKCCTKIYYDKHDGKIINYSFILFVPE